MIGGGKGAVIGAAAGVVGGGLIGRNQDKKKDPVRYNAYHNKKKAPVRYSAYHNKK